MLYKILVALVIFFSCNAGFEVIVYDVGQGNCTLILYHDEAGAIEMPPVIVDCGSKSYKKFRHENFERDLYNEIAQKIGIYLSDFKCKEIVVIASHPDEDHYGWLVTLLEVCQEKVKNLYIGKLYLGGRNKYKGTFKTFIENVPDNLKDTTSPNPVQYVTYDESNDSWVDKKESLELFPEIKEDNPMLAFNCFILPALGVKNNNDASLVVLIEDNILSMIIAGDATKRTTDHILTYVEKSLMKKYILHAAHHGASTHGSNHPDWRDVLQTQKVMYSAGINSGLRHPTDTVVEVLSKHVVKLMGRFIPLYVGIKGNDSRLDFYGKGTRKYGLCVIDHESYSTLAQGTTGFIGVMDPNPHVVVKPAHHSKDYLDRKSCVLEVLLEFPRGFLPLITLLK